MFSIFAKKSRIFTAVLAVTVAVFPCKAWTCMPTDSSLSPSRLMRDLGYPQRVNCRIFATVSVAGTFTFLGRVSRAGRIANTRASLRRRICFLPYHKISARTVLPTPACLATVLWPMPNC